MKEEEKYYIKSSLVFLGVFAVYLILRKYNGFISGFWAGICTIKTIKTIIKYKFKNNLK